MRLKHVSIILILSFSFVFYVQAQKDENIMEILKDHSNEVHSVCFSVDGKQFISGSKDETIKIWDFETKSVITSLSRHYATIYDLEYSHKGDIFFSAGDKSINVWQANGDFIKCLSGHATSVWSVGVSKYGNYLVSGSFDHNFRLWDVEKGETIHVFDNGKKSILATAFSQATNLIAAGSADGSIDIYTFDNFEHIHTLPGHARNIYSLRFSNNGKYLASAARDGVIKIWDLEDMTIKKVLTGHERSVMSVKFSKNDRFIISGSYDATVRVWDVESGDLIYTFVGHKLPVNDVDLSPDNEYILSASSDNTIILWYLNPEILIDYYFKDEFDAELSKTDLFEPKQDQEAKADYKIRMQKAEEFKQNLYKKFILQL